MGESVEWVEIIEPSRREHMFANLKTGQCLWDAPHGVSIKPTHENQWWELFDTKTSRYYYYNATSQKTVWRQPSDGDIISLTKLQMLKAKEVYKNTSQNNENIKKHSFQEVEQKPPDDVEIKETAIAMDISLPANEPNHQDDCSINTSQNTSEHSYSTLQQETDDTEVVYENYSPKGADIENLNSPSRNFEDSRKETPIVDSKKIGEKEEDEEEEEEEAVYENVSVKPVIKSTTLPRTGFCGKTVEKPKFNSFRSKAPPPKPPRSIKINDTMGNTSLDRVESNDSSNKENIYANGFTVSVQKSPRMAARSISKPTRTTRNNEQDSLQDLMIAKNRIVKREDQMANIQSQHPMQGQHTSLLQNEGKDGSMHRERSGSSDDNTTPSGTLLRGESAAEARTSYYERFNNEDDAPSSNVSTKSEEVPTKVPEPERTTPVKRSPLTRMKSDSSDLEKRPRFSKSLESTQFRPVSMLNISANTHIKAKRLSSESIIPEDVPLTTHRKGLFRRRMSIHSMLSWSKSTIKKPMVMTRDKQRRKEAVEVFKLILQCMGDKSSRKNRDSLSVDITTKGWSSPHLRDEIYIQLCKQTTGNEKPTSLRRGWELITACLSIFPPSTKFQSYLEGYIYRNMDEESVNSQADVNTYAKYCYKQLERICQTGAKRGLKGPTIDEINAAIKRVFNPSMFGNSLDDIMEMQKDRFPEHRLPWILTTLTDAVLLHNGLQTEGIFRVPGDIDEVNMLKLEVDRWQLPKNITEPQIPASLLKLWFRDLYEPLIPQRFYDQCIHNSDNPDICLNIVNSLPPLNNFVFSYLIRLLQAFMIPENVSITKMDENNLAMVWAPNCLRCPSDDPREIFENTRKEMTFLRTAMKCLDTAFLQGVV